MFATITSFRGQVLKESSSPVSSSSKETGRWKNSSPGCFLIKIWASFGLSPRHLTFQALHKQPKYRLLDLYFKKVSKRSRSVLANYHIKHIPENRDPERNVVINGAL